MAEKRGEVDFGVLTFIEEELKAALWAFDDEDGTIVGAQRVYNVRRLETEQGDAYRVAVVRCAEQGNVEAQAAAQDAIEDLDPQWLVVVGIAGGVPSGDFTLGDVVVSTRIADFRVEAVLEDGSTEYALGGGPVDAAVTKHVANLAAMPEGLDGWNAPATLAISRPPVDASPSRLNGSDAWRARVADSVAAHFGEGQDRRPKVLAGVIASSDRLVKNAKRLEAFQRMQRQALAVEMESAGVYRAAQGRLPFVAIRGISDIVGLDRVDAWKLYACRTAASFARAFLRTRPIPPRGGGRSNARPPSTEAAQGDAGATAGGEPDPTPANNLPPRRLFSGRETELRELEHDAAAAKPLLERALRIDEATFGPDHPNVAGGRGERREEKAAGSPRAAAQKGEPAGARPDPEGTSGPPAPPPRRGRAPRRGRPSPGWPYAVGAVGTACVVGVAALRSCSCACPPVMRSPADPDTVRHFWLQGAGWPKAKSLCVFAYPECGHALQVSLAPDGPHSPPYAVRIAFRGEPGDWGGWGVGCMPEYDLSRFRSIAFHVRAERVPARFHLKLKDHASPPREAQVLVEVGSTDWTRQSISMTELADQGIDLRRVENLSVGFNQDTGPAVIYLDDIELVE